MRIALLMAVSFTAPASVLAQDSAAALRAEQRALFARMSEAPDDLELMFAYAAVSMRLEDYEAAIATLERMLIFNPDLPRVELELAVAYHRLGSYQIARYHFEHVLAEGAPPEVEARIRPFLAEIEEATARSAVEGFVRVGSVWSSNATLGPADREVRAAVLPGGVGLIDRERVEKADWGLRLDASAVHRYDLRRRNEAAWLTSVDYSGLRYADTPSGGYDAVSFATGPRVALEEETFGATARPFLTAGLVRSGGEPLYVEGGVGLEFTDRLSPTLGAYAAAIVVWRDHVREAEAFDGVYLSALAGPAYSLGPQTVLRSLILYETDRAREPHAANHELGLRATLETFMELPVDGGPWPLRVTLYGQVSRRIFGAPNPDVDPDETRADLDLRAGLSAAVPIGDAWELGGTLGWFDRRSSIENYALSNLEAGLFVGRSF